MKTFLVIDRNGFIRYVASGFEGHNNDRDVFIRTDLPKNFTEGAPKNLKPSAPTVSKNTPKTTKPAAVPISTPETTPTPIRKRRISEICENDENPKGHRDDETGEDEESYDAAQGNTSSQAVPSAR